MKIILASQSPRRKKLLKKIIPHFEVKPSNINENSIKEKNPIKFAKKVAEMKAISVAKKIKKPAIIISADTIVVFKNKIIGKPKNDKDAFRILSNLSGKKQFVITGFCLLDTKTGKKIVDYEKSTVKMKKIPIESIRKYIASGEGRDKAGAYAVQGRANKFVEYIKGDYYNVVGLPIKAIKKAILKLYPNIKRRNEPIL
jgi:septum formation protein